MKIIDVAQLIGWIFVFIVDFICFVILKQTPSTLTVLLPVLGCVILSIEQIIIKYKKEEE